MAEGVTACGLGDAGLKDRLLHRALQNGFVQMVPALLSGYPVGIMARRWKDPLPRPRFARVGVFPVKGVGQGDTTQPFLQIFFMLPFDRLEVPEQGLFDGCGQHRVAVFVALPRSDDDLVPRKVDILDSEAATFHQPQSCPVEQHPHQPRRAVQAIQEPSDFLPGQDNGQPLGSLGANHPLEQANLLLQDLVVEKQESIQRLVLGRGAHVRVACEAGEKLADLSFAHL